MAYEFESKLLDYASGSKTYEEYKAMTQELQEVYRKARAFDHIKVIYDKNMNEMSISDAECIEMIGNELERADDER